MVSVCRGGPGCPPFLSFLLWGVGPARRGEEACGVSSPHDEVLLFRQKDPKPLAPGRGPPEGVPVPRSLVCGLRNSLRSDSPRRYMEGTGPGHSPARRRQEVFLSCPILDEERQGQVRLHRLPSSPTFFIGDPGLCLCCIVAAFRLWGRKTLDPRSGSGMTGGGSGMTAGECRG